MNVVILDSEYFYWIVFLSRIASKPFNGNGLFVDKRDPQYWSWENILWISIYNIFNHHHHHTTTSSLPPYATPTSKPIPKPATQTPPPKPYSPRPHRPHPAPHNPCHRILFLLLILKNPKVCHHSHQIGHSHHFPILVRYTCIACDTYDLAKTGTLFHNLIKWT